MTARRTKTPTNKPTALDTFIDLKILIDTRLARLQELSDEHFGVNPESVHWGHVGDLQHYAKKLKELTDCAFKEGEYAE